MKPTLPADCASCAYRPVLPLPGTSCRRHAPTPRQDEFDLVYWPKVGRNDRCGDGAALGDGTGPSVVACQACIHWHQPNGPPVKPDYRKGLSVEWWAASGYCTRRAPAPATEDDRKVYWPVTNAADSCGAGAQVEVDTNDDEVPALKDAPV
jgi:hypothetical protein